MEPCFEQKNTWREGREKGKEKIYSFVVCFLYFPQLCLKKCQRKKENKRKNTKCLGFRELDCYEANASHVPHHVSCLVAEEPGNWNWAWESDGETRFFFGNFHLRREKLPTTGLMMMMTCFHFFMYFISNDNTYYCFFEQWIIMMMETIITKHLSR